MKSNLLNSKNVLRLFAVQLLVLVLTFSAKAGVVLNLNYGPVSGNSVNDLTSFADFPNTPFAPQALVTGLKEMTGFGNDYGNWTRGFIEAPQNGQYTFWIASDENSELWLSTDANPVNKVKIAENIGLVGEQSYNDKPAQKSALITLQKGVKYYFEVLHKEGTGADHCSVAWTLPDTTFASPLPETALWPYPVDLGDPSYPPLAKAPAVLTDYLAIPVTILLPSVVVEEARPVDLVVTAEATQPAYVQWFSNSVAIPGANLLSYRIAAATLAQNGATYSVEITNSLGSATASTVLTVTTDITPPTLVDALNFGNPGGIVAVVFSENVDSVTGTNAANYTLSGGAVVTAARFGSTQNTVLLKVTGLTVGHVVTVNNVNDRAGTPNTIAPASTISLEQSLDTWLRLDESTGLTVTDSSGNGRNGTLVGGAGPGYVGRVARAVNLDGIDDHVRMANGYADFTTGLTIALWAKPANVTSWHRFIEFANGLAIENILLGRNGTSDTLTFEVYVGGTSGGKVNAPAAIVLNQWQHFVATMDGSGNTVLYRNGVPLVTNVTGVPTVVTRTNNYLGRSNWAADGWWAGRQDDVRVYNRVLSPEAVKALADGAGADDVETLPLVSVVATVPNTALLSSPPGVFTISRTGPTTTNLTVTYAMTGTAVNGTTYTNLVGTTIIPAGSTSTQVFVSPINFSFADSQRTAILTVTGSTNYYITDPANATVTIFNNNSPPTPILAVARLNVVDVWFGTGVTTPTATNFAHYNFNPPLTITNATLDARSLRVVLRLDNAVPHGTSLTVTNVQNPGGTSVSNQLAVRMILTNVANLAASTYHSPDTRPLCLALATNGIADNLNNSGGFDTFNPDGTDFAGLLYDTAVEFYAVKVDLGNQFSDGGSWGAVPRLYRLKFPVDTAAGNIHTPLWERPDDNTNYWDLVITNIISGGTFVAAPGVEPNPSPNTPIVFDLSNLPPAQRTGYGWAVGGVNANGVTFLSISELSGYGVPTTNVATMLEATPANFTVAAGQRAKLKLWTTKPVTYQWQRNGVDLPGETKSYLGLPPVTSADDGLPYGVVLSINGNPIETWTKTLTVTPRVTAPVVRDALRDSSNSIVYVWYDEAVDPGTATTLGNYALNDGALSFGGATLDVQGYRVALTYTGIPALALSNLFLTVSNVMDLSGNVMGTQVIPVAGVSAPAARVVANVYQQGRAVALARSTDNVILNDGNVTTWTTAGAATFLPASDFVGLGYAQPQVWNAVEMQLGWQWGDGGDWAEQPRVYIQKTPVDTASAFPESDTNNWVEVPAVPMSANIFDGALATPVGTTPLPNQVVAFDLSSLPTSQRTGYGWAIGGVRGNGIPGRARFLTISELRGWGTAASSFSNAGPPVIALDVIPTFYTKQSGAELTLITVATGQHPLHFQWLHNGVPFTSTSRIFGANSNVLVIKEFLGGDGGTYQLVVTNALGSASSSVASVALATGLATFNGSTNWSLNGGAILTNNVLQLTAGGTQARSAFLKDQYYIGAFRASFTYQDVGGGGSNGVTFALHNAAAGPTVVGTSGASLGYATAVTPSVALCMNVSTLVSGGVGYTFGANGAIGLPYKTTSPVNFAGGDPIAVQAYYDGATVFVSFSNQVTAATFSTNNVINIPSVLLTNRAYVGFTAGSSGTVPANQRITDFKFTSLPPMKIIPTTTNTYVFTWPTAVGNFVLQENNDVGPVGWTTLPVYIDFVSGQNHVVVPATSGNRFYRLLLQ